MSSVSIWRCQCRHDVLSEAVMGMQFRFFRQHLKAAPAFCISLPSTFTVPVCRLLKDTGMHYFFPLQAIPVDHVSFTALWSWAATCFCISCPQDILPTTTHVEIVALNWTYFLMVFIKWCQTLPVNHWIEQAINAASKQQYRHQAYSNFWLEFRKTLTCTAFLIVFEYIIFSTCRLTISE